MTDLVVDHVSQPFHAFGDDEWLTVSPRLPLENIKRRYGPWSASSREAGNFARVVLSLKSLGFNNLVPFCKKYCLCPIVTDSMSKMKSIFV